MDQSTHKCFIQPIDEEEDEPQYMKVPAAEVGSREMVAVSEDGGCCVAKNTPLFVYSDCEAVTDVEGVQTPILLCCESVEEDETNVFYGPNCTADMFDYLDELTVDEYGDARKVIVVFHNLKGYNGMFVLQYLYENLRDVEDQVTIGTKVLSLKTGDITFKDSLCFLSFPLAAFPATFGISELQKGFFPHLFNTLDNQDYEGDIPAIEFYDTDGMSEKTKTEFLQWHAERVAENYNFNLKNEMKEYCISDIKLLNTGCTKFQTEFAGHADFNPMEKCITIASACNRYFSHLQTCD